MCIVIFCVLDKLIELLLLLTKKDPSVMSPSHVPILLGSYNATLDLTDQLVLQVNLARKKSPVIKYHLHYNHCRWLS